jgi:hypothetical protein
MRRNSKKTVFPFLVVRPVASIESELAHVHCSSMRAAPFWVSHEPERKARSAIFGAGILRSSAGAWAEAEGTIQNASSTRMPAAASVFFSVKRFIMPSPRAEICGTCGWHH